MKLADAVKGMMWPPPRPLPVEVNVYERDVVHHITFTAQVGFVTDYSIETKYLQSPLHSTTSPPTGALYIKVAPERLHPERVRNANMFEFMEWLSDMGMLEEDGIYTLLGRSTLEQGHLHELSRLLLAFSLSHR